MIFAKCFIIFCNIFIVLNYYMAHIKTQFLIHCDKVVGSLIFELYKAAQFIVLFITNSNLSDHLFLIPM